MSGGSVLFQLQHCLLWWSHSFFPDLTKMHPSATKGHVNQQAASLSKSRESRSCPVVLLSLDYGQGMHPNSLDKVRVRAVGPSCSQRATSNVPGNRGGLKKSKDKGKRSKQRRIAKRRNERPSTHPEKNRQRPPDHQARRRSRKESQVAQNGRERVIGQHEEKKRSG